MQHKLGGGHKRRDTGGSRNEWLIACIQSVVSTKESDPLYTLLCNAVQQYTSSSIILGMR